MIKNSFNITAAADGVVTLSGAIILNKFESNITQINFTLPDMAGYAYLLVRHDTDKYFSIPIINKKIMVGSTITQLHGYWYGMICIMESEITSTDRYDHAVYMSDVFKLLVYDNISNSNTPCATEPNVIQMSNDFQMLYKQFKDGVEKEILREGEFLSEFLLEAEEQATNISRKVSDASNSAAIAETMLAMIREALSLNLPEFRISENGDLEYQGGSFDWRININTGVLEWRISV